MPHIRPVKRHPTLGGRTSVPSSEQVRFGETSRTSSSTLLGACPSSRDGNTGRTTTTAIKSVAVSSKVVETSSKWVGLAVPSTTHQSRSCNESEDKNSHNDIHHASSATTESSESPLNGHIQSSSARQGILKSTFKYSSPTSHPNNVEKRTAAADDCSGNASMSPGRDKTRDTTSGLLGSIRERPRRKHGGKIKTELSNNNVRNQDCHSIECKPITDTTGKSTSELPKVKRIDEQSSNQEPLVFNSIADLMEAAGTLPAQNDRNPAVIEAHLQFSCMDPTEYDQLNKDKDGRIVVDDDCEDDNSSEIIHGSDSESESGFDGRQEKENEDVNDLLNFLNDWPDDPDPTDETPPAPSPTPRAFPIIWNALSLWVTPDAVHYIRYLQLAKYKPDNDSWTPRDAYNTDDVASSRCAGLMALMKMHMEHCLHALQENVPTMDKYEIRTADKRLLELLHCLSFTRPMPKLDSAQTRALTCVMLDTVLGITASQEDIPGSRRKLPSPARPLG